MRLRRCVLKAGKHVVRTTLLVGRLRVTCLGRGFLVFFYEVMMVDGGSVLSANTPFPAGDLVSDMKCSIACKQRF